MTAVKRRYIDFLPAQTKFSPFVYFESKWIFEDMMQMHPLNISTILPKAGSVVSKEVVM